MTGVIKLTRNIFRKVCKRDLWRSYEDAYKRDMNFLAELGKFLKSYEKFLTQLKKMKENGGGSYDGYKSNLEKLNKHSYVGERLFEKVKCLIKKQENMYKELTGLKKYGKKQYDCARAWRRCSKMVAYAVFIGAVAAQFACTVVAAVLASPLVALAVAAAIIPTLAGQHWTLSWIEESPFEYPDKVIDSMQFGSLAHSTKLEDTRRYLRSVVDDIKSIEEEEDPDIECCLQNVDLLKEKARDCESEISEARDEVCKRIINFMKSR